MPLNKVIAVIIPDGRSEAGTPPFTSRLQRVHAAVSGTVRRIVGLMSFFAVRHVYSCRSTPTR